jgi:hypothetical protein
MLHIYAALAEKERVLIADRTRAALAQKKARGSPPCRRLPRGSRNLPCLAGFFAAHRVNLDAGHVKSLQSHDDLRDRICDVGVLDVAMVLDELVR